MEEPTMDITRGVSGPFEPLDLSEYLLIWQNILFQTTGWVPGPSAFFVYKILIVQL